MKRLRRLTFVIALGIITAISLGSCGGKTSSEAEEAEGTEQAEHPQDDSEAEHPTDAAADSTEHPSDSASAE